MISFVDITCIFPVMSLNLYFIRMGVDINVVAKYFTISKWLMSRAPHTLLSHFSYSMNLSPNIIECDMFR